MAHTLKIYDGVEGTTLDLCATGTSGYYLRSYPFATQPDIEERKTSSQWVDGELPYYDRRNNITEDIFIDIKGTSVDDLWAKVRALMRALENARDYFRAPGIRTPTYIEFKPQGSTNSNYSTIISGKVDATTLSHDQTDAQHISFTIEDVRIMIEREPFWRSHAPVPSTTLTNWSTAWTPGIPADAVMTAAVQWITVEDISGDLPSLVRISTQSTGDPIDEVIVGLSSQMRSGSTYMGSCGPFYGQAPPYPSSTPGTDTAIQNDTTAIGDPDDDAGFESYRCTFATTATDALRLTYPYGSFRRGTYRLYSRMKVATSKTATVTVKCTIGGSDRALLTVTVTNTDWRWVDFGVFDSQSAPATLAAAGTDLTMSAVKIYAAGTSGTNLDIDGVFLMPVDEYSLYAKLATPVTSNGYIYDNIAPVPTGHIVDTTGQNSAPVDGAGSLYLLPGDNQIFFIVMSGGVSTKSYQYPVTVHYVKRYSAPRGAG